MKSVLSMKSFSNEFIRIGKFATNSASIKRNPLPKMDLDSALEPFWASILAGEEKKRFEGKRPWQQFEYLPRADRSKLMLTKEGKFMHKNYDFTELDEYSSQMVLNNLTRENVLLQLTYPFEPSTKMPKGIYANEWQSAFQQSRLFLLGIQDGDINCRKDAKKLVKAIRPDIVMLELCVERSKEYIKTELDWEREGIKPYHLIWKEHKKEYERRNHGKKISELSLWGQLKEDWKCRKADWKKQNKAAWNQVTVKSTPFSQTMDAVDENAKGCVGFVLGDLDWKLVNEATKKIEATKELNQIMRKMGMKLCARQGIDFEEIKRMEAKMEQLANSLGLQNYLQQIYGNRQKHMIRILHTILQRCTIEKLFDSQRQGVQFQPVNAMAVIGRAHLRGIRELWMSEIVYQDQ